MAAVLFVVAGAAIAERVEKDRAKKRAKKQLDDDRYNDLVQETQRRLSRTESGNLIPQYTEHAEDEEVLVEEGGEGEELGAPPPSYEHVVEQRDGNVGSQDADLQRSGSGTKGDKKKKGRLSFLRKIGN